MKKTNRNISTEELLDYRDIPVPEITPTLPVKNPAFTVYTDSGQEFIFDLDKSDKIDFDA